METRNLPSSLLFTANPWTLAEYPDAETEWTFRRKLEFFAEAGCDASSNAFPPFANLL
jgi:hypothetical protein